MSRIWAYGNEEKENLDLEVEKHGAYIGKDLWFGLKNGIQDRER